MHQYQQGKAQYDTDKKKLEEAKQARVARRAQRIAEERAKMEAEEAEIEAKVRRSTKAAKDLNDDKYEDLGEKAASPLPHAKTPEPDTKGAKAAGEVAKQEADVPQAKSAKSQPDNGSKAKRGFAFPAVKSENVTKKPVGKTEKQGSGTVAREARPVQSVAVEEDIEEIFTPGAAKSMREEEQQGGKRSLITDITGQQEASKAKKWNVDPSLQAAKEELAARARKEQEEKMRKEAQEVERKKRAASDPELIAKKKREEAAAQAEIERELAEEEKAEQKRTEERRAREETAEKMSAAEAAARAARGKEFEVDCARKKRQQDYFKKREDRRESLNARIEEAKKIAAQDSKQQQKVPSRSQKGEQNAADTQAKPSASREVRCDANDTDSSSDSDIPPCIEETNPSYIRGVPNVHSNPTTDVATEASTTQAEAAPDGSESGSDDSDDVPLCVEANAAESFIRGVPNPHPKASEQTWVRKISGGAECPVYDVQKLGNYLQVSSCLQGVSSAAELDFEVCTTEMELSGNGFELKLAFTKPMSEDDVKATFDKKEGKLTLKIRFA